MNEIVEKQNIKIENLIYEIRGVQVMLSSDVAKLYQVEPKVLNQTIKRNINRFPESFCFQLNEAEIDELSLRSQFVTLNKSNNLRGQHFKYLPYVLTEQGIMMLSGLLRSDIAVKVNIQIIDAFVKMRRYFSNNQILINHENRLLNLEKTFEKFKEKEVNKIFFEGQIYDAYSLLMDIFNTSNQEIIIIDNYIDKSLLDILRKINIKIIIITSKYNNDDYNKYKMQYKNITLKTNNKIHDRFIIIDKKELYHCGASLKDLGKKCFAVTRIENNSWIYKLLQEINI